MPSLAAAVTLCHAAHAWLVAHLAAWLLKQHHQSDIAHVIIHETPTQSETSSLRHYTSSLTQNINTVNQSLLAVSRAQPICTERSYLISHSLFTTCIQSPNKHQHCQSTITWIQSPRNNSTRNQPASYCWLSSFLKKMDTQCQTVIYYVINHSQNITWFIAWIHPFI